MPRRRGRIALFVLPEHLPGGGIDVGDAAATGRDQRAVIERVEGRQRVRRQLDSAVQDER